MRYSHLWSMGSVLYLPEYCVQSRYGANFLRSLVLLKDFGDNKYFFQGSRKRGQNKEPLVEHSFDQL